jgi:antitoxin VapB
MTMAGYERPTPPERVKLFKSGGSQAVRLTKAYRFEGDEVSIHREGDRVILEPVAADRPRTREEALVWLKAIQDMVGPDFPDRDQPPPQERDWSAFD